MAASEVKITDLDKPEETVKLDHCIACRSDFEAGKILSFRCGDCWCMECLENKFRLSLKDETMYPPRCCYYVISLKDVKKHLSKALIREFQSRELELKTKNKTYCHKPNCSAFIAPHSIHSGEAICQKCGTRTCSKCRGKWHFGPCSEGDNAEFMEFALSNTWKRCPQCKRMVEKDDGCNHMLCRCGCEFCYGCGNKYSNCNCKHDEDDELNDDETETETSSEEPEEIESTIERHRRLEHRDYVAVSARGRQFQCGSCERTFYNWISRCDQCELSICNYCRRVEGRRERRERWRNA